MCVCVCKKLDTRKQRSKGKASITHSLTGDSEAEIARKQSRFVFVICSHVRCKITNVRPVGFVSFCHSAAVYSSPAV